MEPKSESATYTHGHHPSVLRSHTWRTALNSAAYLLPHLTPSSTILDIGCGPGTITIDLAASHVPQGHVTGLDTASARDTLAQARALAAARGVRNVSFVEGDANALTAFADGSFDVVVCHQVLQHVRDPAGVLREMRRVARQGGLVAARESDYGGFVWYPPAEGMARWRALYGAVARANGGEPDAGRALRAWAREAGFGDGDGDGAVVSSSSSTWCYSGEEEVAWWSGLWAERTVASAFAKTALARGIATEEDLEEAAEAWRTWGRQQDAWFSVLHGEIICRK